MVGASALLLALVGAQEPVDFDAEVRPLLAESCLACHGPDESGRKAGLRLDTREGATRDLGGYAAVVPSEPRRSALLERVSSADPDERMPPPDAHLAALTAEQVV